MERRRANWLRTSLALGTVFVGAAYLYAHAEELGRLREIRSADLVLLVLGMLAAFTSAAYIFRSLLGMLSTHLAPKEWLGLTFLANALNYILPTRPGVLLKATYLRKHRNVSYSLFSSILAAGVSLSLTFTCLLGLVTIPFLALESESRALLAGVSLVVLSVSAAPLFVPLFQFQPRGWLRNHLNHAIHGFSTMRGQSTGVLRVGLQVCIQHLISACCCVVAFRSLGFGLDFSLALALAVFTSLSNILALTPSNLGTQELVMASLYSFAGLEFSHGIVGAALIRAVHVTLTFALAPIFTYVLLRPSGLRLSALLWGRHPSDDAQQP